MTAGSGTWRGIRTTCCGTRRTGGSPAESVPARPHACPIDDSSRRGRVPLGRRASIAQWAAGPQERTLGRGEDAVMHADDGNRNETDEYSERRAADYVTGIVDADVNTRECDCGREREEQRPRTWR